MTAVAFVTDAGTPVPAVTTEQMREIDRVAIEEVGPNLYQMMENAGRNLALAVLATVGARWASTPIVVLAGTGGNGGGGICAARHLANRGAKVTVALTDPARLAPVTSQQFDVYSAADGELAAVDELDRLEPGVVVDAVIGYSLGGAPRGAALRMIEWCAAQAVPVVSLDVPSGVDATSGQAPGAHIRASSTLTLALPKTGLDAVAAGDVWLADIGIPRDVYRRVGINISSGIFGTRYRVPLAHESDRAG